MSFVRFLMLLALVIWVGGIAFFAFVLAPTVFHPGILPSRQLAGQVVSRSLGILHWMGLGCGVVFLVTSVVEAQVTTGFASVFSGRNLLVFAMIVLTLVSVFAICAAHAGTAQRHGRHRQCAPRRRTAGGVQPVARVVHPAGEHRALAGAGGDFSDRAAFIIESSETRADGAVRASSSPDQFRIPPLDQ